MILRFGFVLGFVLALAACGSSDETTAASDGLQPPAWIQGTWEGGSPTLLHLKFTADRILDEDGKDALPGYREVGADDSNYVLTNDSSGWSSQFSKTSASKMKWVITTPNNSTVTTMTKK